MGGWPNAYDLDKITNIIVSHGDVLDGIRVTYRLKNGTTVEETHGGPWYYAPGDSRLSTFDIAGLFSSNLPDGN